MPSTTTQFPGTYWEIASLNEYDGWDEKFVVKMSREEFTLKEYMREPDGTWVDEIPDGNDHSIDDVRYAMLDDCLRG